MARRKRNWRPYAYYHVVMRGNNRQNIFATEEDMYHLMRCIAHAYEKYRFTLIAFCIMTNHYHLLIRSEDDLSKIMREINRRYSDYYSKRYNHVGRIYQRRYFSKEVDTPQSLLAVSRYIHRNPIETKIPMVKRLADYPFSSFPLYDDTTTSLPYIDIHSILRYLPPPFEKTSESYIRYCLMEVEEILDIGEYISLS
ncbi:transposase [Sporosarcina sp. P13]|uniref:transposase n=1 Tax=Sporosarcina sp. P13 TaxID=2048263 RepID=UPI000C16C52B|nr:transposase [Sporosarcina sp. P13]PIC63514.1 transposase [Sporosarcina sp. P13]